MNLKTLQYSRRNNIARIIAFSFLVFFSLLNVNLVRVFRDTVCVLGIGVHNMSFVKGVLEIPFSIVIVFLYNFLYNKVGRLKSFLFIFITFIAFFLFFGIYTSLYNTDHQHFNSVQQTHVDIDIKKRIPYIFLFLFGETWPVLLYSFLIWSFVHTCTPTENAKKDYPIYSLVGQISIFVSGFLLLNTKTILNNIFQTNDDIMLMSYLILLSGIVLLIFYLYVNNNFLKKEQKNIKENSKKDSVNIFSYIRESYDLLKNHNNIRRLSYAVIFYVFIITSLHFMWIHTVITYYNNSSSDFIRWQGYVNYYTGALTILFGLFAKKIFAKFKWNHIFTIIPAFNSLSTLSFLISIYHDVRGLTTLVTGTVAYVVCRSSKYVLFDTAKEIFFSKYKNDTLLLSKSKSLIDIICFKFGKSLGANFATLSIYFFIQNNSIYYIVFGLTILFAYLLWIKSASRIRNMS